MATTGIQDGLDHPLGEVDPVTLVPARARWAGRRLAMLPTVPGAGGLPGLSRAGRGQLADLFGSPDLGVPGTPGLLPRQAVSWEVLAEPASIAGGLRSLLLQATQPLAMAGVARHSRYATDPLGRLAGTSAWVTVAAFGSAERAVRLAATVRAMHARVRGRTDDGRAYAADAPELLAWVQCSLTASLLATHQLLAPRALSPPEADRFVLEQSFLGAVLDPRVDLDVVARSGMGIADDLPLLRDGHLPRDAAGLASTLRRASRALEVGEEARDVVRFLRAAPLPSSVRPAYRVLLTGVGATLPDTLAECLGLVTGRAPVAALAGLVGAMRLGVGRSPSLRAARRDRT